VRTVIGAQRWSSNWVVAGPPGAVRVDLPRSPLQRRPALERVLALPAGSPVVLAASAPGARRRCRSFAARAAIVPEREFLAFPSSAAPGCLVEDTRPSIALFVDAALLAPPGTGLSAAVDVAVAVVRAARPWRLVRLLAPGRLVVGRRA
jgi:hypothetical protein